MTNGFKIENVLTGAQTIGRIRTPPNFTAFFCASPHRLREHRQDDGGEEEAHINLIEWYQNRTVRRQKSNKALHLRN